MSSSESKSDDFLNSTVHLNVGGKRLMTSRKILTLVDHTLLSQMFSDPSEKMLIKDGNGDYFLDYDPLLFKQLVNQLRYWSSNPYVTRVFSAPIRQENEFISFLRSLRFNEKYLSDTFSETIYANVNILDHQRLSIKTGDDQQCAFVMGNLHYFQGKHTIKLMALLTKNQIGFIGIRPANLPFEVKTNKNYLPIPNTFGVDNNCLVIDGQRANLAPAWSTIYPANTFLIELDCDSRSMCISREQFFDGNHRQPVRFIDLTMARLPWQLFIVLKDKDDYVRIML